MRPLRRPRLAAASLVTFLLTLTATYVLVARGGTPLLAHPVIAACIAVGALALARAGWSVRKLKRGEDTTITPVQASAIALMGQAGAIVGALLVGYMAAQVVIGLLGSDADTMRTHALGAGLATLASAGLVVSGLLVEGWCIVDDDDDDDLPGSGSRVRPTLA